MKGLDKSKIKLLEDSNIPPEANRLNNILDKKRTCHPELVEGYCEHYILH